MKKRKQPGMNWSDNKIGGNFPTDGVIDIHKYWAMYKKKANKLVPNDVSRPQKKIKTNGSSQNKSQIDRKGEIETEKRETISNEQPAKAENKNKYIIKLISVENGCLNTYRGF